MKRSLHPSKGSETSPSERGHIRLVERGTGSPGSESSTECTGDRSQETVWLPPWSMSMWS
jgi:hypothetical protein